MSRCQLQWFVRDVAVVRCQILRYSVLATAEVRFLSYSMLSLVLKGSMIVVVVDVGADGDC